MPPLNEIPAFGEAKGRMTIIGLLLAPIMVFDYASSLVSNSGKSSHISF
jgi:hypothetical protein